MLTTSYSLSYYKGILNIAYPKNIRTNPTESYCLNIQGDLLWCYFSSELGIFLKNMNSNITERILTIQNILFLEIDYNLKTDSYILFYNYKNRLYIKYMREGIYITKEILNIKTSSEVFMTYHKLSGRITLIFKDRTNNFISEVNSDDDFESIGRNDGQHEITILSDAYASSQDLVNAAAIKANSDADADLKSKVKENRSAIKKAHAAEGADPSEAQGLEDIE